MLCGGWKLIRAFLLPVLLLGSSAVANAGGKAPEPLQICIADIEVPAFTAPDHEGPAQRALRQAARKQGREVVFVVRPWRRCFVETAEGRLHGMLPVVASAAARRQLRFPEVAGQPDASLSLDSIRVRVIRAHGSSADWDGQAFSGLQGPVLFISGLKDLDDYFAHAAVPADSTARDPAALARMLLRGRSNVAVDLEGRAQSLVRDQRFRGGLELLPQPLLERPLYLAFSPSQQAAEADFTAQLWRDMVPIYRHELANEGAAAR